MKNKKGFTLIELLVVIVIIGILVSVAVANYIVAQKQARDAARTSIMHNAQTVLEQYFAENGKYPRSQGPDELDGAFDSGSRPSDPSGLTHPLIWNIASDGSGYCVCAHLETGLGNAASPGGTTCSWNPNNYFCIQNQQ